MQIVELASNATPFRIWASGLHSSIIAEPKKEGPSWPTRGRIPRQSSKRPLLRTSWRTAPKVAGGGRNGETGRPGLQTGALARHERPDQAGGAPVSPPDAPDARKVWAHTMAFAEVIQSAEINPRDLWHGLSEIETHKRLNARLAIRQWLEATEKNHEGRPVQRGVSFVYHTQLSRSTRCWTCAARRQRQAPRRDERRGRSPWPHNVGPLERIQVLGREHDQHVVALAPDLDRPIRLAPREGVAKLVGEHLDQVVSVLGISSDIAPRKVYLSASVRG